MHCPICKTAVLVTEPLDENLLTMRCPSCNGHWVKSFQYWKWRESHPTAPATVSSALKTETHAIDSRPGKLCPECGRFLMHRPVGHGVTFSLDRCGHCGGMWFDKHEWNTLQHHSLGRDVHFVFTKAWQAEVKQTKHIELERARLHKLLGESGFRELMRITRWVYGHEKKEVLLAVINNADSGLLQEENG